jgi:hypothetical protein
MIPPAVYFDAIAAALSGLEIFMRDDRSPLYRTASWPRSSAAYSRLERSFSCWRNRLGFMEHVQDFARRKRLSGVPERARAGKRPQDGGAAAGSIPPAGELREEMADFILRHKDFPKRCSARWPSGSISRTARTA